MHLSLTQLEVDPDRLLDPKQTSQFRGGTEATLARDRWARVGIPYVKLGRKVFYRAGDVAQYVQGRRVSTHAA